MCRCEDRPCCGCHLEEAGDIESELESHFGGSDDPDNDWESDEWIDDDE